MAIFICRLVAKSLKTAARAVQWDTLKFCGCQHLYCTCRKMQRTDHCSQPEDRGRHNFNDLVQFSNRIQACCLKRLNIIPKKQEPSRVLAIQAELLVPEIPDAKAKQQGIACTIQVCAMPWSNEWVIPLRVYNK